jgi:small subunit ribosomal protein S3
MWQKVDPRWFRTGIVKSWTSEYFASTKSQSAKYMVQDLQVRNLIDKFYKYCGISKVVFRKWENASWVKNDILIFTWKPALVLWKDASKLNDFKQLLSKTFKEDFDVTVKEVSKPELSARIMWEHVASSLERRMPYRKVIKTTIERVMWKWAKWIKISIAWRLNGAEMARTESFKEWRIPLQTFRADVDYHYLVANTKYWILWLKIWIYKWDFNEVDTKTLNKSQTVLKKWNSKKESNKGDKPTRKIVKKK